jgi:hypothetical protein
MITVNNALASYYASLQQAGELCGRERQPTPDFVPDFILPPLDARLERFFAASTVRISELQPYRGVRLRLLDLTCNPRTRTTKTFAVLLMVARAVRHIEAIGESVLIVTPTSGNKGSALRDAVLRAIESGLVEPRQLRIAVAVPQRGLGKMWALPLSESSELRELNPVFTVDTDDGRVVKDLTRRFVRDHSRSLLETHGLRAWHTYDLDNYRSADAVRAFIEADYLGEPAAGGLRVHAQAVSSAFGLLGHHFGWRVLQERLGRRAPDPWRWLLVQHLGTPDLVLHHLFGSFSPENFPRYSVDSVSGSLTQSTCAAFPKTTFAVDEVIDSTFYSHQPATTPLIERIQHQQGGGGIVVSLQECLQRYSSLRRMLPEGAPSLPADPRDLREWALVMVLTGVLEAVDRDLIPTGSEVVVHVSGSYSRHDYRPLPEAHAACVATTERMLDRLVRTTTERAAATPALM